MILRHLTLISCAVLQRASGTCRTMDSAAPAVKPESWSPVGSWEEGGGGEAFYTLSLVKPEPGSPAGSEQDGGYGAVLYTVPLVKPEPGSPARSWEEGEDDGAAYTVPVVKPEPDSPVQSKEEKEGGGVLFNKINIFIPDIKQECFEYSKKVDQRAGRLSNLQVSVLANSTMTNHRRKPETQSGNTTKKKIAKTTAQRAKEYRERRRAKKILKKKHKKPAKSNKQRCKEYRARKKARKCNTGEVAALLRKQSRSPDDREDSQDPGQSHQVPGPSNIVVDDKSHSVTLPYTDFKAHVDVKIAAQHAKEYRERRGAKNVQKKSPKKTQKQPAKSNKQRCKEYRARKKAMKCNTGEVAALLRKQSPDDVNGFQVPGPSIDVDDESRFTSTPAQRAKEYRERQRAKKLKKPPKQKKVAKSNKQRCKEYKARQKAIKSLLRERERTQ